MIKALGNNGNVAQTMDYYPFGAEFCHSSTASDVQSRKYNGKELDKMHGLNTYDYGARQYNPVTARWDRVDPLCEKYYDVSPYSFCLDSPINLVDRSGMDWISFKYYYFLWAYYDDRIHSREDIEEYYYDKGNNGQYSISYIGSEGLIYNTDDNKKTLLFTLNSDGSYKDANGHVSKDDQEIIDDYGVLHIGNNLRKEGQPVDYEININKNWHGSYLGPRNPKFYELDLYSVPPVDELDFAAYLHDREYDMYGAVGFKGAIGNLKVANADFQLYRRALSVCQSTPKGTSVNLWAERTALLFKRISSFKYSLRSLF